MSRVATDPQRTGAQPNGALAAWVMEDDMRISPKSFGRRANKALPSLTVLEARFYNSEGGTFLE